MEPETKREKYAAMFIAALICPESLEQSVKIPIEKGYRIADEFLKQGKQ